MSAAFDDATPERVRSTAPPSRPRIAGPLWREGVMNWVRIDGRTWPLRPASVLAAELAAFDAKFPCRTAGPAAPVRVHRVWKEAALAPLRVVASVAALERRAATYSRDARTARPAAAFAAEKSRELAERQRTRVAALPVRVPWAGRLVGQGVSA